MTTEQKLDKLIDLFIAYLVYEYDGQPIPIASIVDELKQLKTEEIKPDVTTPKPTFIKEHAGRVKEPSLVLTEDDTTEEGFRAVKPDITTSEEIKEQCFYCKREEMLGLDPGRHHFKCASFPEPTPWLPNPGDGYYTIHPTYNVPIRLYWGDPETTSGELALRQLGLIFKTREEAVAKINILLNL